MGILYTLIAIVLFGFASRNLNLALRAKSKSDRIEYWIGAAVCFIIALGLLFAGCSNNSSNDSESENQYNSGNQNSHPWDSPLEKYKEDKKPWE
jgi:cytochrome bd-type quinol oxidase subunit 2